MEVPHYWDDDEAWAAWDAWLAKKEQEAKVVSPTLAALIKKARGPDVVAEINFLNSMSEAMRAPKG